MPSAAVSCSGGSPNREAASARNRRKAPAAAVRSGGAACGIDRLPNVPRSNGETSVSAMASATVSARTASSSATSSESAVRVPWPASTFPVNAVTVPSAPTWIQASSGAVQSAGSPAPATTASRPSGMAAAKAPGPRPLRSHGTGGAGTLG